MEQDLKNAQMIQQALLPHQIPALSRITVDYRYFPMESVGGDYFSFTMLREGGMGVFLGDVTGHGVSAALFLALVKAFTDRVCRHYGQNPKGYLSKLNFALMDNMTMHFLTAIYGYFKDNGSGDIEFIFSQGGHPPPVLYRKETGKTELLSVSGSILGVLEKIQFHQKTIGLHSGDILFLFTDGIHETMNDEGEMMGLEYLQEMIRDSVRESLHETLDTIMDRTHRFRQNAPVRDDIVLIGFGIK